MPTPRPEMSVIAAGGRNAGGEDQVEHLLVGQRQPAFRAASVRVPRPCAGRPTGSIPRPSSLISITIRSPRRDAAIVIVPVSRLSGGRARLGRFDAVVERHCARYAAAARTGDRRSPCRDSVVSPRVTSSNLLAEPLRQVAHQARKRPQHLGDRHHAQAEATASCKSPPAARSRPARAAPRATDPARLPPRPGARDGQNCSSARSARRRD